MDVRARLEDPHDVRSVTIDRSARRRCSRPRTWRRSRRRHGCSSAVGFGWVSARTPLALLPGQAVCRWLLVGAAAVYFLRVCVTSFYLIRRRMDWSEAVTIAVWVWIVHPVLALLGGSNAAAVGWGVAAASSSTRPGPS